MFSVSLELCLGFPLAEVTPQPVCIRRNYPNNRFCFADWCQVNPMDLH